MSSNFDTMFDDFKDLMDYKCCDDERKELIKTGRSFLFVITPPALFYGRYLTEEKYSHLFRSSKATAKHSRQKRKRAVRSSIPPIPSNDDCSKTTENSSKPPQTSTPKKKKQKTTPTLQPDANTQNEIITIPPKTTASKSPEPKSPTPGNIVSYLDYYEARKKKLDKLPQDFIGYESD